MLSSPIVGRNCLAQLGQKMLWWQWEFAGAENLQIYIVPQKAKVNADFFTEFILKPMVKNDIPALYGKHAKRVVFHVDSTPAHTAKKLPSG